MPTAGDAFLTGQLPTQYNPLQRLNFNTPTLPIDPVKILTEFITFLETYGLAALQQVTGIDFSILKPFLDVLKGALQGIDLSNPGSILVAIETAIQNLLATLIQQLLTGGLGGGTTGTDPVSILVGLLNQALALPADFLALIFGGQATSQAQINAINTGGFSHDFASNGVTGWSNLVGALALSSRGNFIQALTETVAYRASGVSSDKLGAHFVVNPSMRGVARLGICSNTTATKWAGVEVYRGFDGDALRLVTGSSPTLTAVRKQADFISTNRFPAVTAVDVKTDGVNKFSVLFNNQPVPALDWTDGGAVTHDASHRNVVLTSNGVDRSQDGYYGPAITKVVSYAW